MNHGSTLFLKLVIYAIGLAVTVFCVLTLYVAFFNEKTGLYIPVLIGLNITAVPFFFALYQGLLLLRYIDSNSAFSELSVRAIKNIKQSAFIIAGLYAALMPFIFYAAEIDDAPGAVLIGLIILFAFVVVGVFAAVLQKLLQNAIDIKKENELTI